MLMASKEVFRFIEVIGLKLKIFDELIIEAINVAWISETTKEILQHRYEKVNQIINKFTSKIK